MLHKSSDKVRYCYQHALECRDKALRVNDLALRDSMLAAEDGWIRLAQSYVLTESLIDFSKEVRRHLGLK